MNHSIVFQYLEDGWDEPNSGYQVTDREFPVPQNGAIPRAGEYVQLMHIDKTTSYIVRSVVTRIVALDDKDAGWVSVITVGPLKTHEDRVLSRVRD